MIRSEFALSLVIPVYDEEAVLPRLFAELTRVRDEQLRRYGPVEIVLVNDGSKDRSWELIAAQCARDPGYVGVNLSRNFGHQLALAAGLETARGDAVVSLDADLQDPPEVVAQLMDAHRQGYDVVYATRAARGKEPWGKRVTAQGFYWVIEKLSGVPVPRNTADFRLLSRRALAELSKLRESHRFLRGLVPWIGFPQTKVFYDRGDRAAGETHYPWHKMLRLAFDGIASMSTKPLRLAYVLSLALFAVFLGYIIYVVFHHFIQGGELVPGWTSIMSAITIFGTIQLLLLGIFGEYLGRIYEQVKQRPLYIINEIKRADQPVAARLARPGHAAAFLFVMSLLKSLRAADPTRVAFVSIIAVTLFRLWYATRIELVPDEAYYWLWSKHLALSYRDKGPLIGWTIALGTQLFGDTVFGIRFFAVVLSGAIGWQLFVLARRLYDARIALWCLGVALVMPLMAVGSILMTIDSLSLFFWAWGANVLWTALDSGRTRHWFWLGVILGLGFLAKFTNGVQLGCIFLLLLWSKSHRTLILSRQTVAMCVAFGVTILPLLYWNWQTGWIHFAALHSRSGVEDSFGIHPLELLRFLGEELGIVSPLLMIGMVVAAVGLGRAQPEDRRVQFLLCQFAPVFALFIFFSLNKAGKGNWPAPGLITGIILLVVYWRDLIARAPRWRWAAYAALGLAGLMTFALHTMDFVMSTLTLPPKLASKLEVFRRAQGWADFARHVQRAREQYGANLLIGNHYDQASMMRFYLPDRPVTYLPKERYGKSQFSLWPGYEIRTDTRALFVSASKHGSPAAVTNDFPNCQLVDDFESMHRGRPQTRFRIYLCTPR